MKFTEILEELPTVNHLQGIDIFQGNQLVHHIPAIQGKLGSLSVYNALAEEFSGILNTASAEKGLVLFCEHTKDAQLNMGKHPNIDLLQLVIKEKLTYKIIPVIISKK